MAGYFHPLTFSFYVFLLIVLLRAFFDLQARSGQPGVPGYTLVITEALPVSLS